MQKLNIQVIKMTKMTNTCRMTDITGTLREVYNLVNKANLVHNLFLVYLFLSIFINLYVFRGTMCPSSGETTVFMRHLILVILKRWIV